MSFSNWFICDILYGYKIDGEKPAHAEQPSTQAPRKVYICLTPLRLTLGKLSRYAGFIKSGAALTPIELTGILINFVVVSITDDRTCAPLLAGKSIFVFAAYDDKGMVICVHDLKRPRALCADIPQVDECNAACSMQLPMAIDWPVSAIRSCSFC